MPPRMLHPEMLPNRYYSPRTPRKAARIQYAHPSYYSYEQHGANSYPAYHNIITHGSRAQTQRHHFPSTPDLLNSPENQFAKCLLLMLGVKLITLSVSESRFLDSGVLTSAGTVLPRGRVGVGVLSLVRRLSDLGVRLYLLICVGVGEDGSLSDSAEGVLVLCGVEGDADSGPETTLMVDPNSEAFCSIGVVKAEVLVSETSACVGVAA